MLIDCARCVARVDAKILYNYVYPPSDEGDPYGYFLLDCPSCHEVLLAGAEPDPDPSNQFGWYAVQRLWPEPKESLDGPIPPLARKALEDAHKCYSAGVYSACAVMCGKAIEAICVDKTGKKTLAEGLRELKNQNVIDDRLFAWSEVLREQRNIGAHAVEDSTTEEDARDILDFATAICEYIYVLSEKYDQYIRRKSRHKRRTSQD